METGELQALLDQNKAQEKQLTKRNEQYLFDLRKALKVANLSEEEQGIAISKMLPELLTGQTEGRTARQLFGTVAEQTERILTAPKEQQMGTKNQMWLDNSLFLFSFLSVMAGIMPLLSKTKNETQQQGIVAILIAAITGGYAFYLIFKYVSQYDLPGADVTKKPKVLKSILITTGIMLGWMVIFMMASILPPSINFRLEPVVYIVLGVLVFGIRYLIKKKFGIRGSLFMR